MTGVFCVLVEKNRVRAVGSTGKSFKRRSHGGNQLRTTARWTRKASSTEKQIQDAGLNPAAGEPKMDA
jgi:hypothetical protein